MQQLTRMQWSDYLDIAVVAFLIYKLLPLVRAPGTMRIARAVIAVMVVAGLAAALRLYTLSFILNQFMAVGLLALVILLLAVVAAIYRFWGVVCLFFAAAIVAYLLSPLVKLLTLKGKVPRGVAVAVTALLLVGLITWGLVALIPYAVNQIGGLVNDLSFYADQFDELLDKAQEILASWHLPEPVLDWISGIASKMDTYLMTAFKSILTWLMNTTSGLFDMVVVMILVI